MKLINGESLYHAFHSGKQEVVKRKDYLNKINVFPVADGDTGSNLAFTIQSIMDGSSIEDSVSIVSQKMADAALAGSRGNSGIIFAQFIQGLNDSIVRKKNLTLKDFTEAAHLGAEYAYKALKVPVEGTILSVMRSWANALNSFHEKANDFTELLHHSLISAKDELAQTTQKLEALQKANVVDAGAQGFVNFLEGFYSFIKTGNIVHEVKTRSEINELHPHNMKADNPPNPRYCTEGFLTDTSFSTTELLEMLSEFGNSIVVAGSQDKTKFHIHTNSPANIFELITKRSVIKNVKVDDMQRQFEAIFKRNSNIALVTDSACDLPFEIMDKFHINLVPINISFGENNYLDKITINSKQFYSRLESKLFPFPKTSQPSVSSFKKLYNELLNSYDFIISIHLSDKLSGTFNAAQLAAASINSNKIKLIDSKHLSTSLGLIVLEAAQMINSGKEIHDIINQLNLIRQKTKILVSVKTLKYMVKGGRVSPLKGLTAKLFNIKPIVSLDDEGASLLFGKAFSESSNIKKICKIILNEHNSSGIKKYAIGHANNLIGAKELEKKVKTITGKQAEFIYDIAPVIGANAGIGAVSISYIL